MTATTEAPTRPLWHDVIPQDEGMHNPYCPFAERERIREQISNGVASAEKAGRLLAELREALAEVVTPQQDAYFALTHIGRYDVEGPVDRGETVGIDRLGIPLVVEAVIKPNGEKSREALAFLDSATAAVERYRLNAEADLATVEQAWEAEDAVPDAYELNLRRAYATALFALERFERDSYLEPDPELVANVDRWASALQTHQLAQISKESQA